MARTLSLVESVPAGAMLAPAVPGEPRLVYCPHPFMAARDRQLFRAEFLPGESIADYLARAGLRVGDHPFWLHLNDRPIERAQWATTFPHPGDLITLRARLEGGGGGGSSNPLRTVLTIALLVYAPQLAGALGFAAGGTAGLTFGTAVVMVGGSLLINQIAPLPVAQLADGRAQNDSPTFSLTGASNRARPYEPLPLVCGTHKIFPDLGAKFYTEFLGEDQYLYAVFNFGLSDITLSEYRIGDTLLSDFSGVEIEETGTNELIWTEQFDNAAWGKSTGVTVTPNTDTAPDATLTVDTVTFPSAGNYENIFLAVPWLLGGADYSYSIWLKGSGTLHLDGNTFTGNRQVTLTGILTRYDVAISPNAGGSASWQIRLISYPGDTATSFKVWGAMLNRGLTPDIYTRNRPALTLFPANIDTVAGGSLTALGGWVTRTSGLEATALAVDIGGLLFYAGDGGIDPLGAEIELEYRAVGAPAFVPFLDSPSFGIPVWTPNTYYEDGRVVIPSTFNGHRYRRVNNVLWPVEGGLGGSGSAGVFNSDASEPTWLTAAGSFTVDGPAYAFYEIGNEGSQGELHMVTRGWVEDGTLTASSVWLYNTTRNPLRATYRRNVPSGQYEVRARRISPDETDPRATSDIAFAQLRTYQPDPADYAGQKRLAVKIKASGQLQGGLDQFSAIASARVPVWTATAPGLQCDGIDDVVTLPAIEPASFTAEIRLIPFGWATQDTAFPSHHFYPAADGFGIVTDGTNWTAWINTSGGRQYLPVIAHNNAIDVPHHAILTYDATTGEARFYVDGAAPTVLDLAPGTAVVWGGGALQVSHANYETYGQFLQTRLYSRAISAGEAAAHYAGTFTDESGLELLLRFEDGPGTQAADSSGHARHGTLTGGPVWVTAHWVGPVWTGVSWQWLTIASSNPVWWFLWLARGKKIANRRVFGALLPDARLDIETLKAWGAWCDAHNLTFDFVFDRAQNCNEMLAVIAQCGRGAPTWASGKLGMVWDQADLPAVAVFGMGNIKRNTFQVEYLTGQLADEIVVGFINPALGWQPDTVRVTVPGVANPVRPAPITLIGCKNENMAGRAANLLAAEQLYRRRRISWECDFEGMVAQRGDVAILSHDLTQWGYSGRMVRGYFNLLLWSEDFSNAAWTKVLTATVTGTNTINLPAEGDHILQNTGGNSPANKTFTLQWKLSGTGTVSFFLSNGVDEFPERQITLTSTPTVYSITHTFGASAGSLIAYLIRRTGDTATQVTAEFAQAEQANAPNNYVRNAAFRRLFVQLDRKVPFTTGQVPYLGMVFPNGFYQVFDVEQQTTGESNTLVLDEAWPLDDGAGHTLYAPDVDPTHPPFDYKYTFDPLATPGKRVKIVGVQPLSEQYLRLTATDEEPNYYLSETDPYIYVPSPTYGSQAPAIADLLISDTLIRVGSGFGSTITLSWNTSGAYGEAAISVAAAGQPLGEIGRTRARRFEFTGPATGALDIEVKLYGPKGQTQNAGRARQTYSIAGKGRRPQNVTDFRASQNGALITAIWTRVSDVDVNEYELRYGKPGIAWDSAAVIPCETVGRGVTTALLPPGTWDMLIKAKDTSGLYSADAARASVTVTNEFDLIFQQEQAPEWGGAGSVTGVPSSWWGDSWWGNNWWSGNNWWGAGSAPSGPPAVFHFLRHWTGVLVPDSTRAAADHSIPELFEQFVPYPQPLCVYETEEIDVGFDDNVRIWGAIDFRLGRGQVSNGIDPQLYVDTRLDGGSFDGFEPWSIGEREARFIKYYARYQPVVGSVGVLAGFLPTADVLEHTEVMKDEVIAAGGSVKVFPQRFHFAPTITVTPKGATPLVGTHQSDSPTQTTAHLWSLAGSDVGGTADISLRGA